MSIFVRLVFLFVWMLVVMVSIEYDRYRLACGHRYAWPSNVVYAILAVILGVLLFVR